MATQDLIKQKQSVNSTLDNVVIVKVHDTVPGGRTLNTAIPAEYPDTEIQAGHVILRDAAGEYYPQPTDGSLPVGSTVVGVLTVSIAKASPEAAIMTRGVVDESALRYPITAATKTALTDRISYLIND